MSEKKAKDGAANTRAVELKFGYQDKETDASHRRVVFGRRPTGGDFIKAAENCGGSDFQFSLELAQSAVVEFGTIEMPVPMTVLLSLNQIDREIFMAAYFGFLIDSGAEGTAIDGKVELGFGIERGNRIKSVEFGKLLNGYDEIEIENESKSEWQTAALRMAKQIVSPSDLTLAEIEALDVDDFTLLRNAEEEWLNSFRNS